jgi:uncharacterized membrane protein
MVIEIIRKETCRVEIISRYVVIIVLAICLCLGYIIKHSISFIPNKYIPLIMAVVGTILNVWISGWKFTPEILLGGLASGLASTGTYEMIKNITRAKEAEETPAK